MPERVRPVRTAPTNARVLRRTVTISADGTSALHLCACPQRWMAGLGRTCCATVARRTCPDYDERMPVFKVRTSTLALVLPFAWLWTAAAHAAPSVCQVLDRRQSHVGVSVTLGAAATQAELANYKGSLLLKLPDASGSKVKLILDPASIAVSGNPQLTVLLQSLLAGRTGESVTFVSDEISRRSGTTYHVTGTAEQGSRRDAVRMDVRVTELTKEKTRIKGSVEREPGQKGVGAAIAAELGGRAEYDLVFVARAPGPDGVCGM